MKKIFCALVLSTLLVSSSLFALSDTTSSTLVTPGVVHTQYTLSGPNTLDVLEIDIKNPHLTIESYRPNGLTKTTVQAAANDKPRHRVIGAINADFFSFETGWPVNNQVVNGKPVQGHSTIKSQFVFTKNRKVHIDGFSFSGKVFAKNGTNANVNEVNYNRDANQMLLYTSFKGGTTGTDVSGSEAVLNLLSPEWVMNDTLVFVVSQKVSSNGNIPSNGAVLSGVGTAATYLNTNIALGDTVKLFLTYNPRTIGAVVKNITQVISGNGRLIKDGVPYPTIGDYDGSGASFNDARHPRTFVGINADTSKVYFCTVDGRQASSIGMAFTDMANFLLSIGVKNAFNLDGGGSTTMVVRDKVVNSPSDPGGERSVANTLQLISTAPAGTLHYLNIIEDRADIFQGNTFRFHAEGKDEYLNPLALPAGVVWETDTTIGTIDSTGLFTAKVTNDTGWVRIKFGNVSDSVKVFVRVIKQLRVFPKTLTMVPGERLTFTVRGVDSGNNTAELQNSQVVYQINATNVNVDPVGVVTSTGFGSGTITVTLDTVKQVIRYSSSGVDTTILVENFDDVQFWSWHVTNTDPDNVFFELSNDAVIANPPAFRIKFDAPPASNAIISTSLPISSRPDTIRVKVYGDGGGHTVKLFFRDKDNQQFVMNSTSAVIWNNEWRDVYFRLVNATPVAGGTIDYPIVIEQLQFTVGSTNLVGGKATDTIYVDDIRVHYPNRTVAPQVLFDFNSGITGWLQPFGVGSGQTVGITTSSKLEYSTEHPYEGTGSGKWTLIDDGAISTNWNIRIARTTSAELADMLRGSYISAWVWADGKLGITMRTVIRGGTTGLCQGPAFPVNHIGWKLIGVKLDENLFTTYITSGKIVDTGNKFNGFHVEANNADVNGKTVVFFVDKMVTSALTVPSGFLDFGAVVDSAAKEVTINWSVNSEISINRYEIERSEDGVIFSKIGSVNAVGNIDTTKRYSFTDQIGSLTSAKYRIVQITNDGAQEVSPPINVIITGIGKGIISPFTYSLDQNFPNPFNPSTQIFFSLATREKVKLKIFDVLGREVATAVNDIMDAGRHSVHWNAANASSGVYFYRIEISNFVNTKKMMVVK